MQLENIKGKWDMTISEQIAQSAYKELIETWHGEPSWQDFIAASKNGKVRVNKTIAAQAIHSPFVHRGFRIFYGSIINWVWVLLVPICLILALLGIINYWWILGGFLASLLIKSVTRDGHCEGIKYAAECHEEFYKELMRAGAFLFEKPLN